MRTLGTNGAVYTESISICSGCCLLGGGGSVPVKPILDQIK